jgi:hypothetical protein
MRLLEGSDLRAALQRQLSTAREVDVAVAWARSSEALDQLQEAAARGVRVRAIVGLAGNHTQPAALRTLLGLGHLRIANGDPARQAPGGIFHPKVFVFRGESGCSGWIGSANLTDGGFCRNLEAVWEIPEADALDNWFRRLWDALPGDPRPTLKAYEDRWEPPEPPSRQAVPRPSAGRLPRLQDGAPDTWEGYFLALSAADAYWQRRSRDYDDRFDVLGENFSWVETIRTAGSLIRRPSWSGLSDQERYVLLGIGGGTGNWGLLGSMRGAGRAKQVFRGVTVDDRAVLARLRAALSPLLEARGTDAAIGAAVDCLRSMVQESGISYGVATRLMACARPDVAVSVNAGSAPGLAALTGLPSTPPSLARPDNYERLLRWVARQPWQASAEPADPWQSMVWRMRAALIDCFVYEPV